MIYNIGVEEWVCTEYEVEADSIADALHTVRKHYENEYGNDKRKSINRFTYYNESNNLHHDNCVSAEEDLFITEIF